MAKGRHRRRKRAWLALLAGVAALPAAAAAAAPADRVAGLLTIRAQDARVATIGYRLAVANRAFCSDQAWLAGFAVHDLSQYGGEDRDAAARTFGLGGAPAVLALVEGGPAAAAGLRLDDHLLSIDGADIPRAGGDGHSFDLVEDVLDRLDAALADGVAELGIRRQGQPIAIRIEGVRGCPTRFQAVPGRTLQARADGIYVQVTSGIVAFVASDDELAALLAHEFAHNVLRHRRRLDDARVSRGLLANFGRNARLIRATEVEADRLSVHLLDRAGFDVDAGARFWRRFGPRGIALFDAPTHPPWRSRVAALAEEAARIRAARAAGTPIEPPIGRGPLGAD